MSVNVNVWVCISVCAKFQHFVYGDVDIDRGNGYRTHSLHLSFVAIASIIFGNTDADIDGVNGPLLFLYQVILKSLLK